MGLNCLGFALYSCLPLFLGLLRINKRYGLLGSFLRSEPFLFLIFRRRKLDLFLSSILGSVSFWKIVLFRPRSILEDLIPSFLLIQEKSVDLSSDLLGSFFERV